MRDRVELAGRTDQTDTAVCGVQLRAGLGDGRFADPVLYRLPVGDESGGECPELGVVLTAPTAAQNRLAVTYENATGVEQVFDVADGRFTLQSRFAAGSAPFVLASRDFDGDGYGDLYTLFLDLDRDGGTDILVTWSNECASAPPEADPCDPTRAATRFTARSHPLARGCRLVERMTCCPEPCAPP